MGRGYDINYILKSELLEKNRQFKDSKKAEDIKINDVEYVIDKDSVVYDLYIKAAVGIYNREKKEWIKRYEFNAKVISVYDRRKKEWITRYQVYNREQKEWITRYESSNAKVIGVYDREKKEWHGEIIIDGVEYLIDEDSVVYDVNSEKAIGVYNREKKEWIMRD